MNTNPKLQEEFKMNEEADPTPSPIPYGYSITAYILIVEQRHCDTCQSIHEAPAHSLRVQLINHKTQATKTISLPDLRKFYNTLPSLIRKELSAPVLPRYIRHLHTDVPFCPHCFTEVTEEQPDLLMPDLQLLTPYQVAHLKNVAEQLVEEYGRAPTKEELKQAAKTKAFKEKPKKAPVGTLDLTQFF